MDVMMENPLLIQKSKDARKSPLFLIHDGGGTIFSYFMLGDLQRTAYGISNPYFGTDSTWENGIVSMAERYAQFIKATVSSGGILLGGWSLGGLVSIQLARIFASDPDLNVTGIVMMDSYFPIKGQAKTSRSLAFNPESYASPAVAQKIRRCYEDALTALSQWDAPVWQSKEGQATHDMPSCPPTILLRASKGWSEAEPDKAATESTDASEPSRGFERYETLNLHSIVETPGDHFTMFNAQNVNELSQKLKEACDVLAR